MAHPPRSSSVGDVPYMGWGSGSGGYGSLRGSDVNLYWSVAPPRGYLNMLNFGYMFHLL